MASGIEEHAAPPLVVVGCEAEKAAAVRQHLPDAVYASISTIAAALKKAIASLRDPMIPRQAKETAPGRTAAQKMGSREASLVGLIDAPPDYSKVIGELPLCIVTLSMPAR